MTMMVVDLFWIFFGKSRYRPAGMGVGYLLCTAEELYTPNGGSIDRTSAVAGTT
jgi:hypothetical protein